MRNPSLGRIILTYVSAGPPVGLIGFLAFMSAFELMRPNGHPIGLSQAINGLPFLLAMSYIIGALPAIVTSLVMALTWKRGWSTVARLIAAPVAGAVISCLVLFWIILGPNGDIPKWAVIANFAVTGGVAALVSTLLLERWSRRRKAA
jgi:hypothetical protein